ncbi:Aspartate-tRNA ligase, cytoplasmic, partial [Smittium culicis]
MADSVPTEQKVESVAEDLQNLVLGPDGEPLSKKALKKLEKEREKERRKQERAAELAAEKAAREANVVDYAKDNYGKLEMNQSSSFEGTKFTTVRDLETAQVGSVVTVIARVQTTRPTGAKMCFLVLREGTSTVQALVSVNSDSISKQMVKFADTISAESLVRVTGVVVKPDEIVKSCTVGNVELHISTLFITSEATSR